MTSQLLAIAVRKKTKAPMLQLKKASATPEHGIANDLRGKPGPRQVTLLSQESWNDACSEVGKPLDWQYRRANLLIQGFRFGPEHVGRELQIGAMRLRITRQTDPCRRMDLVHPGLNAALNQEWRGGVCAQIILAGDIQVGDAIEWL